MASRKRPRFACRSICLSLDTTEARKEANECTFTVSTEWFATSATNCTFDEVGDLSDPLVHDIYAGKFLAAVAL